MATSSIIENIQVNNPKAVEAFVSAMESNPIKPDSSSYISSTIDSDPEKIRSFVKKGLSRIEVGK